MSGKESLSHRQKNIPKTSVSEHGDRHSPRPTGGPDGAEAVRRVARGGRAAICHQNPSSRGRGAEGLRLGAASLHSGHLCSIGPPNRGPRRTLIPGDGAVGDQGGSEQACLPGNGGYATPAACPVSTTSWRHGLWRTCRHVTGRSHRPRSTWPDQARLASLAVTCRYKRARCLWLEQFSDRCRFGATGRWRVRDG
jgi:hypothetical protein